MVLYLLIQVVFVPQLQFIDNARVDVFLFEIIIICMMAIVVEWDDSKSLDLEYSKVWHAMSS